MGSGEFAALGYGPDAEERFVPEQHSGVRNDFARDRARVLHSSGWRRLAAKTQVLSPTAGIDFARNRLTHSLEVAQIGRELAVSLDLAQDVVDTACLAHDIGHPPFGHNGERALDEWMTGFGGFEGNAQTLRVLARLEPKRFDASGASVGLNLTRAVLDASCKYPWPRSAPEIDDAEGRVKFGYYEDDAHIFDWVRTGVGERRRCVEAQVMDLSDDIAYSVHDFEDAVVSGYIDPELLTLRSGHGALIRAISEWAGGKFTSDELAAAFDRIESAPTWLSTWEGSRANQAQLKNFTSDMIGRFARASIQATREHAAPGPLARYGADVIVPREVRAEIAVLKGIVAAFVMASGHRQPTYRRQRELLLDLLEALWAAGPGELDPAFAADFRAAESEGAARRAVVDQLASLTDQSAIAWHKRLCDVPLV
ncbi:MULTISPECIES: deoxyguanosinetriphosphate triphosphohydrolase [unclassified Leucobacter]|uniref:deoxyguanosinetriphosphate triphosphohydrolase n=1 Tax=unclassified Leucobacter TaxID=2621730 RepID=UPI00165E8103|nr:deoxyguanosinetriphosphate triphosphohydrolase [Leucobacter sp. CX169]MBC9926712.1 deoxyguanosinetriphosphate triphosphohydrolase [Leucobacter sp. cx-169]MBC9935326.1 deoxyguanosinetriphosphate triphosphohydrolase [Leucobacter sp. cx-87]